MAERVSIAEATRRLIAHRDRFDPLALYAPSQLADVIWPDRHFLSNQGAARAALGVLHRVPGARWTSREVGIHADWGWDLSAVRSPHKEEKP